MLGAVILTCATTSTASAQWTVINLHPAGGDQSYAYSASGGQQVGVAWVPNPNHATLWTGSAASWVDLNPAGATYSYAYGVSGGQKVGIALLGGVSGWHASLWSGTAASWVDLNPVGANSSVARAVDGGQQVGYAYGALGDRASLWRGTADSWVDLSPAGATGSRAYGVSGDQQVGEAGGNYVHASLWRGTAASWVDLHPAGAVLNSYAYGVHGGQQVGSAYVGGIDRASLWTGTADSWVDLSPAGAWRSVANAVYGGQQVGNIDLGGWRASLWRGTADSWVDLHLFLPSEFVNSEAHGIWNDGSFTYVVGFGYNNTTRRNEALMWVGPAGVGCYVTITQQPVSRTVDLGQQVVVVVAANASGPLTYQWKKGGVNVPNGGRISGAKTATLTINNSEPSDNGDYTVVVSASPCSSTSTLATILVICPSDYNRDGYVDPLDYNLYINAFEFGSMDADFNHDGFLDPLDYNGYINAFESGC